MQENLFSHAAPARADLGRPPGIIRRFPGSNHNFHITPPPRIKRGGYFLRVKILTYDKCFNSFYPCLGAFLFLGYAAWAGSETPSSGRAAPPVIRHRPMIGRLFRAVILRSARRPYERIFSRCYPYTRNLFRRRYGHSTAAERHSRRAVRHRPTVFPVLPGLHNMEYADFLAKIWPLF